MLRKDSWDQNIYKNINKLFQQGKIKPSAVRKNAKSNSHSSPQSIQKPRHLQNIFLIMIDEATSALNDTDSQAEDFGGEVRELLHLPDAKIRDVWADNFQEEMKNLSRMTERFNVIAMDTEFPGIYVSRNQISRFKPEDEVDYFLIRSNVEQTKLIQIGLTIADEDGNVPHPICTWQFNFKFDINKEKIVSQSANLLKKAGVQFDRLKSEGIDLLDFAEYFEASGFVYHKNVKWVVFHGSSDFAYLLRLVRNAELPSTIDEFYRELKKYFPNVYDLKYIIKDVAGLKDVGLAKLSYQIGCNRIGPQHQAGSDSLLTLCCYFKMLEQSEIFGPMQFSSSLNVIFGIGSGYLKNNLNGYQQRDYETNSYMPREYYGQRFYDGAQHNWGYMNNYNAYGGNGGHGQGPLYSYLNQQHHGGYMMYSHDQQQQPQPQQPQQHGRSRYT